MNNDIDYKKLALQIAKEENDHMYFQLKAMNNAHKRIIEDAITRKRSIRYTKIDSVKRFLKNLFRSIRKRWF